MGLLDIIHRGTHTRVSPTGPTPPVLNIDPATGQPIAAPTVPAAEAMGASPAAPPPVKKPGLLSTIGSIFAPEAGSWWAEANQHGIFGAKEGMQDYANDQADTAAKRRSEINAQTAAELGNQDAAIDNRFRDTAVGGVIQRQDPTTGEYTAVTEAAPPTPTREQTLVNMIQGLPEGSRLRTLLEASLAGYRYTPEYTERTTQDKIEIKRAVPGKAPSSGGGKAKAPPPPPGFQ